MRTTDFVQIVTCTICSFMCLRSVCLVGVHCSIVEWVESPNWHSKGRMPDARFPMRLIRREERMFSPNLCTLVKNVFSHASANPVLPLQIGSNNN